MPRVFNRIKAGGIDWHIWNEGSPELIAVLERPDAYLPPVPSGLPRGQAATSIAKKDGFFLKRYNHHRSHPTKIVKSFFRTNPAELAFEIGWKLIDARIRTPRPLAAGTKSVAGVPLRGYVVTELICDARVLVECRFAARTAAHSAAALIAALHDSGFIHRDLNLTNLAFDGIGELFLMDLDTARRMDRVTPSTACEELARFLRNSNRLLPIPKSVQARFLKEYCRLRAIPDWKQWWRDIALVHAFEMVRLDRKRSSPKSAL